jgi:hypothetical protein
MMRIIACAVLWFCAGCVGELSKRQILRGPTPTKLSASAPELVRDENKPGQPVVSAYFSGTLVMDADMKGLADHKQLQTLDLRNTSVTDAGLKDVAALTQLRELYLIDAKVTDAGLKQVAKLKQLQKLYLVGARVTDAGLKNLVGLDQLKELNLSDTMVTDAGQRKLRESLPACQIVDRAGWPR